MKKLLLVAVALLSACSEPEYLDSELPQCVYKPVGYCEQIDGDSFKWTELQTESILSEQDKSILRNISVVTCEECAGQEGIFKCESNNFEIPCEEIK